MLRHVDMDFHRESFTYEMYQTRSPPLLTLIESQMLRVLSEPNIFERPFEWFRSLVNTAIDTVNSACCRCGLMANLDTLTVACSFQPGSGSSVLNVDGTSVRFQQTSHHWQAQCTPLLGADATVANVLAWIRARRASGKRLAVHAACHGTQGG